MDKNIAHIVESLKVDDNIAVTVQKNHKTHPIHTNSSKDTHFFKVFPYSFRNFVGKEEEYSGTLIEYDPCTKAGYVDVKSNDFTYRIPLELIADINKPYKQTN